MINGRQLYLAQRLSAVLLVPLVLIHLALIIIAVRNGLSAAEILGRTRGSLLWGVFYTLFVLAVAVHVPLGVRNVMTEWTRLQPRVVDAFCLLFCLLLLIAGMRAVFAVV